MSSSTPQGEPPGDVAAVVPAAGASRRMGRPKLILPWEGGNVLEATLAALLAGGVDRVVVVTEPGGGVLARWSPPPRVTRAVNPAPDRGMLSSVRAGLAALVETAEPRLLLVCPGDLPALRTETVRELLAAQRQHGGIVVPTCRGRRGHPLIVPRRWLPAIGRLDDAVGLRQLLRVAADDLLAQPVQDAGTVLDVDTPEAYESLRAERGSHPD